MSEWEKVKLGEARSNQFTYSPKDNWKFANYLDTGNITENRISEIQFIDLAKEGLPSRAGTSQEASLWEAYPARCDVIPVLSSPMSFPCLTRESLLMQEITGSMLGNDRFYAHFSLLSFPGLSAAADADRGI